MDARQVSDVDIRLVSFDIPMSIQRRIGAAIIAFARFEHNAELTIWHLLDLDGDPAKLITGKLDTPSQASDSTQATAGRALLTPTQRMPRSAW